MSNVYEVLICDSMIVYHDMAWNIYKASLNHSWHLINFLLKQSNLYSSLPFLYFVDDIVTISVNRDELAAYQQIDATVWKALVKATDSANVAQRSGAYSTMITATLRGGSVQQLVKTMQVLVKKIKNESSMTDLRCIQPYHQQEI
jgi:hypothetical protein